MSCPYLEKGRVPYCHAFGKTKLALEDSEAQAACFSGEFGECAFLFAPFPMPSGNRSPRKIYNNTPGFLEPTEA